MKPVVFVLAMISVVSLTTNSAFAVGKGKASKSTPCHKSFSEVRPDEPHDVDGNSNSGTSSGESSTGGSTGHDIDSARTYGTDSSGFPSPETAW